MKIGDVPIENPILSGFPIAPFDDTGGYSLFDGEPLELRMEFPNHLL